MKLYARSLFCLSVIIAGFATTQTVRADDRPNFVWILSEDNSKHFLKLFDEHGAETPNIAKLAEEGIVFNHAFSNSPVCSVARTTLITGIFAPRIGTQYHRKIKSIALPEDWKMFPAYLNEAGYFTTNNSKKDYNADETPNTWDESSKKASWRDRPEKSQPFFHMQTFTDSHESSLHFSRKQMENQPTETDPETVFVPEYHPRTETFKYTYARYHDRIKVIDGKVGEVVAQLKEDGLLENTFIFYFGDHGGVLPRSKGYVYETGLHIPLVVRVPEKFRKLAEIPIKTRVDGFVSFVDFGPTMLNLAGIKVPEQMDGTPFLGPGVSLEELNQRNEAFGYADRFDEKYEMVRTLRQGNWKYHRNFQGYYPDGLQNNYRYKNLAWQEWRELWQTGKLNEKQQAFFEPKPAEALYDLSVDPYEMNNLAGDPKYADKLSDLRLRLAKRINEMPDLSFLPEPAIGEVMDTTRRPYSAKMLRYKRLLPLLMSGVDPALLPYEKAEPELKIILQSPVPLAVYWTLGTCCHFGEKATALADLAKAQLHNERSIVIVRLRAAEFLAIIGEMDPQETLMKILKESDDPIVNLMVLQTIVYLRDFRGYEFDISPDDVTAKNQEVERRLEYLAGPQP